MTYNVMDVMSMCGEWFFLASPETKGEKKLKALISRLR